MPFVDLLLGGAVFSILASAIDYFRANARIPVSDVARIRAHVVSVPRRP